MTYNYPQTILGVGSEGGSARLVGLCEDGAWRFRVESNEHAMGDDELASAAAIPSAWYESWPAGLHALDRYPWQFLHPLSAHAEFSARIEVALQARLPLMDEAAWRYWREVLAPPEAGQERSISR
jgi:hypothetical protein